MNLYCTKCSKFTKNNNIKTKCEVDLKMDLLKSKKLTDY